MATAPTIRDYVTVWITRKDVVPSRPNGGFLFMLRTQAQVLIDSGAAVLANGRNWLPFREGTEPRGFPPNPPEPEPLVLALTAFTAANPTVATCSSADALKANVGDSLVIDQTAGTSIPTLEGATLEVLARTANSVTLDLDLSAAAVAGVTALGTVLQV